MGAGSHFAAVPENPTGARVWRVHLYLMADLPKVAMESTGVLESWRS